jgi:hypothetical protein
VIGFLNAGIRFQCLPSTEKTINGEQLSNGDVAECMTELKVRKDLVSGIIGT